MEQMIKNIIKKYRYSVLVPLSILVVLIILLIIMSGGSQKVGFIYQVF